MFALSIPSYMRQVGRIARRHAGANAPMHYFDQSSRSSPIRHASRYAATHASRNEAVRSAKGSSAGGSTSSCAGARQVALQIWMRRQPFDGDSHVTCGGSTPCVGHPRRHVGQSKSMCSRFKTCCRAATCSRDPHECSGDRCRAAAIA